jgi:hypothetical protein
MNANGRQLTNKPDAGNPHVRFDEEGGTPPLLDKYTRLNTFYGTV